MKIGEVVVLTIGEHELNALVVHVIDEHHLNLLALSIHAGDVGFHGRLSEIHSAVPHASIQLAGESARRRWRRLGE